MNLARLNHILIPPTKEGRDRLRHTLFGRIFGLFGDLYFSFTREGRVVLLICFLAGLFGLEVRTRQSYLMWSLLFGLVIASIAIRRTMRLVDVRFSVEAPRLVSVGESISFRLQLSNRGTREHQVIRIDGPLLPWDGQYLSEQKTIASLPAHDDVETSIEARFSARGQHHLDPFVASALAPFGLVSGPLLGSRGVRFLVVPRIAPVQRLRTPRVHKYQPGGVALASQTGESMELLGLRPYRAGDPVRDIHAKRWARLGAPVVREYQQEYFTRIGVVVDTDIRHVNEELLESGLSLAAGVLAHLSRGEALIDLLVVGQEIHQMTLGRSLGFLDQALELLAVVEPGPQFDADTLARRLSPYLRQLSCVVFVSLEWSRERQALVDRIVRGGVGCRVLQVSREEDVDIGSTGVGDITRISGATIESAEVILL